MHLETYECQVKIQRKESMYLSYSQPLLRCVEHTLVPPASHSIPTVDTGPKRYLGTWHSRVRDD